MTPRPCGPRLGVTVVEVLFAMLVALVGLMGVLAIVPLASRQASDSYMLTHTAGAALNSAATIAASDVIRPTAKRPWCFDDDRPVESYAAASDEPLAGTASYKPVDSVQNLYTGLMRKAEVHNNSSNPLLIRNSLPLRRQIYGQGFCFDPMYYASVNATNYGSAWVQAFDPAEHVIRRTRLPFVNERYDLANSNSLFVSGLSTKNSNFPVVNANGTPSLTTVSLGARLIRVSAWSSGGGPVRRSVADQIVSALGDTVGAQLERDKSFGAIREFEGGGNAAEPGGGALLASSTRTSISWLATLVPMETINDATPSHFTLSIAMIKSRERFIELPDLTLAAVDELPEYERVAMVSAPTGAYSNVPGKMPVSYPPTDLIHLPRSRGGILTVTMTADSRTNSQLRAGDHVLLSRTIRVLTADRDANGDRFIQRHRWYRIIGLDGSEAWPRNVTLQGPAWDYPEFPPGSTPAPAFLQEARTTATIIPDVVAVFEIPITIDNES